MAVRQLPSRFPVGTRYVIEGHRGEEGELCVISRKIIMPNGKSFDLKDGVKIGRVSFARPRAARLKEHRQASIPNRTDPQSS
jgi:hypothetical protein